MKLLTVLVLPLCGIMSSVSQDKTYQNSISALISPNLCQLKLICAISKSQNAKLLDSMFMRGIRAISDFSQLTPAGNTTDARLLSQSVTAGVEILVLKNVSFSSFRRHRSALQLPGPEVSVLGARTHPGHRRPRYYRSGGWTVPVSC